MTDASSIDPHRYDDPDDLAARTTQPPDPEYPHIPHPIVRPRRGSPYYIDPRFGKKAHLFRPGAPVMTSADVRRELEDFP